jgi:alkylation response protein AidB-like acyl-CoA dehydrogenase
MDFAWSQEDAALRAAIVRFARQELGEEVVDRDRRSEFSWEGWKKCAAFGIQGLPIPPQFGGGGANILTTAGALESLGYGCRDNGLVFSINAHMWSTVVPIATFGSEAQKNRYLTKLVTGEWIGAHAMSEPMSGSDAYSLRTRAERRGDVYVLNGRKTFITNAPTADLTVVFASVDLSKGAAGVTAFIVEKGAPGMSVSRALDKMGLRTSPMGELVFEDCEVPAENLLGRHGGGAAIFTTSMEWERICIQASQVGVMERLLESSTSYVKERQQFGQPIGKFQSIANRIADMELRLEAARLMVYKAAWLKKTGKHVLREAALAKLFVSEACIQTALDAVQIRGGYGYMTEFEIERDLRDSIAGTIYSGTSEIQKMIIAGFRGL